LLLLLSLLGLVTAHGHHKVGHGLERSSAGHSAGSASSGLTARSSRPRTARHSDLLRVDIPRTSSGRARRRLRVKDGGSGVHGGNHARSNGAHSLSALSVLLFQLGTTNILALGQSHINGLGSQHATVHLSYGLGGFFRFVEADKAKSLAVALFVGHDLDGSNATKLGESLSELLLINGIIEVLDIQVDSLPLVHALLFDLLELLAQLSFALTLLLGTTAVDVLLTNLLAVEITASLLSLFVRFEIDESKSLALSIRSTRDRSRSDLSVRLEKRIELRVFNSLIKVLDINVGESFLRVNGLAILLRHKHTDIDNLSVQQHAVNVIDGCVSILLGLVVDETITLRISLVISNNLARQDVTESAESVVQSLVVKSLVQVLDEDVGSSRLSDAWVTVRPHNTARTSLNQIVVKSINCTLSIISIVEVNISVSKRTTSHSVSAHTNGSNRAELLEHVKQQALSYLRIQITNIQ